MAAVGHFGCPKFIFDGISGHFRSIRNFFLILSYKMAVGAHFGCSKFNFDHISGHFRSICNFFLNIYNNGCRRPFWMSEIHFRLNFWPFQIDKQLYFFLEIFDKMAPSAILDVRNSLSIAFLAILDQYDFCFEFFYKMAAGGHIGCSKITCISGHFRSIGHFGCLKFTFNNNSGHFKLIPNFFFGGHFGCPKITFDHISGHFRSIQDLNFLLSTGGHFGCPKITFDSISGHFRSMQNFFF